MEATPRRCPAGDPLQLRPVMLDEGTGTALSVPRAPAKPAGGRPRGYWADLVLGRLAPAAIFSVFIVLKLEQLQAAILARNLADGVIQALGLVVFSALAVLFVVRLRRQGGDRRVPVVLVSFFGTFALLGTSALPQVAPRAALEVPATAAAIAGLAGAVWCLAFLRRSFSILPEARRLVTGGPYGIVRHPLYVCEAVAGIGVTLPTVSWPGLILIAVFVAAQLLRMRWEEEVLARHFGEEYERYRRRVPKYLPWPRPR